MGQATGEAVPFAGKSAVAWWLCEFGFNPVNGRIVARLSPGVKLRAFKTAYKSRTNGRSPKPAGLFRFFCVAGFMPGFGG